MAVNSHIDAIRSLIDAAIVAGVHQYQIDCAVDELSLLEHQNKVLREDNSMLLAHFDAASSHMVDEETSKRIAVNASTALKSYTDSEAFWDSLTEEQQIQVAVVMFKKLNQQLESKGSFRHMIYNVFGWGPEAYSAIYAAGGMNISNMLFK